MTINLISDTEIPVRPTITVVDALMRQVSEQTGTKWQAVAMQGGWMFKPRNAAGTFSRRRSFVAALATALNVVVVTTIQ